MGKTYSCPYCTDRGDRENLIAHIDEEHEMEIPEGFTPERVVFNAINKKPMNYNGVCVVCKRESGWNPASSKYNRICGRKECREALRKDALNNHIKAKGVPTLLGDPEHQAKMLAARSISDKYKFKDGGYHVYTGSYEKKALEFLDQVMGFKSSDLLCPGPTIEYEFEGKTLKWITDILLIPFNLIIEVKDGGSNPNNRQMDSYRQKQIAKENQIIKLGKYNYLRLTNNDFSQLLYIIAELKSQMIDDEIENKKVIININEEMKALEESVQSKKVSNKEWKELNIVYDSLSDEEKEYLGNRFVNSPRTAFSKVYKENGKPVAFIQAYGDEDYVLIGLAVSPSARGKGYAVKALNDLIDFAKTNGIRKLVYNVRKDNKASIKLAEKVGFEFDKIEDKNKVYIMNIEPVQEAMALAGMNPPVGISGVFMTQYGPKTSFTSNDEVDGYAIHKDILTDKLITVDKNNKVSVKEFSFLKGRKLRMFKYIGESFNGYSTILQNVGKRAYREYLYETLTNKKLLSDDQVICDEMFKEISPAKLFAEYTADAQTIVDEYKSIIGEEVIRLPLMDKKSIREASFIIKENTHVNIFENMNGYFAENALTRKRTGYYKQVKDIEIGVIL